MMSNKSEIIQHLSLIHEKLKDRPNQKLTCAIVLVQSFSYSRVRTCACGQMYASAMDKKMKTRVGRVAAATQPHHRQPRGSLLTGSPSGSLVYLVLGGQAKKMLDGDPVEEVFERRMWCV